MFVGLRPAASFPSSTGSASRKSSVDNPRRYSSGSTSATRRPPHGGRIRLVNRWRSPSSSTRRSFTRGARTFIVPAPQVTFRDCARPSRTTRCRPSASRAAGVRLDVLLDFRLQRRPSACAGRPLAPTHPGSARRLRTSRGCLLSRPARRGDAATLMQTFGAELTGNKRTLPRTQLLCQLRKRRARAAFRGEEERRPARWPSSGRCG